MGFYYLGEKYYGYKATSVSCGSSILYVIEASLAKEQQDANDIENSEAEHAFKIHSWQKFKGMADHVAISTISCSQSLRYSSCQKHQASL